MKTIKTLLFSSATLLPILSTAETSLFNAPNTIKYSIFNQCESKSTAIVNFKQLTSSKQPSQHYNFELYNFLNTPLEIKSSAYVSVTTSLKEPTITSIQLGDKNCSPIGFSLPLTFSQKQDNKLIIRGNDEACYIILG